MTRSSRSRFEIFNRPNVAGEDRYYVRFSTFRATSFVTRSTGTSTKGEARAGLTGHHTIRPRVHAVQEEPTRSSIRSVRSLSCLASSMSIASSRAFLSLRFYRPFKHPRWISGGPHRGPIRSCRSSPRRPQMDGDLVLIGSSLDTEHRPGHYRTCVR